MNIHYSDGRTVENAVIDIWDDWHTERAGYVRAFWVADPINPQGGSPVVGYCSPGGSHKTIRACVDECARLYPGIPVFRNGRQVNR